MLDGSRIRFFQNIVPSPSNQLSKMKSIALRRTAVVFTLFIFLIVFTLIAMEHRESQPASTTPVMSVAWSMKGARHIDQLETHLMKSPADKNSRIMLAQAYLREAQQSLQEAYYLPKAQTQIEKVLKLEPDNFEALALQASLFNTLHQFEKAQGLAEALIEKGYTNTFVYGVLVDALVELGRYEEAIKACDQMVALRPGIASYSRVAYLRELHGDADGAYEAMALAAEAGVTGEIDRSWALYQLGQLHLADNDFETAEFIFEGILDETPYYAYAIGGLAQVAMQEGNYEAANDLFDEAYAFVPADEFLEGKLEIATILGEKAKESALVEQLTKSYMDADAMGENVRMEYADFLADLDLDLEEALELAKMEYKRRPNHLHALETYAWTLHKNGRSVEAIPHIEQAMRLETGDAMVHFRAGHIYAGAERSDMADFHFESALNNNLHVESPSAAKEAMELLDFQAP